ncbi:hypothetical protein [Micropruina glycogenica]|uniref:Uncharacterized protein n=1 Tax=Micropruina glycogenica TaxID=75385 RepID=A0A2N9JHU5_9ACTN|nr:hypothetical protein [Micropruina glycogenica]SPD87091.1 conserved protein of unknown function [Micropruina glycogenica]
MLWQSANEYRFTGLPMRLIAPLMRPALSLQHMRDFKAFAEHGADVREAHG